MTNEMVRALAPPYPIQPRHIDTSKRGKFLCFRPDSRKTAIAAMCTIAWFVVKICQSKNGWQPFRLNELVLRLFGEKEYLLGNHRELLASLLAEEQNYRYFDNTIMVTPDFVCHCFLIAPKA